MAQITTPGAVAAASSTRALRGRGAAGDYCATLLDSLGIAVSRPGDVADPHPALDWAACGAMALTGAASAPPQLGPQSIAAAMRGTLTAFKEMAPSSFALGIDGPELLGERAAILGYTRNGRISAGGSCRLLRTRDGWLAVNLPRRDDVRSLPAWLGEGDASDRWHFVERSAARHSSAHLLERARLLGLAVAEVSAAPRPLPPWYRIAHRGRARAAATDAVPVVVDLSSLWAGPLAAQLLQLAGARVIKVESTQRPDGARRGPAAFYDLLNYGKQSVAIDLDDRAGRRSLARLLERADIVIESSRPRALRQLGIYAETMLERVAGLTWLSITGYGRSDPQAEWVAFGDDAAAAAGLALAAGDERTPMFCADAIADPIAGAHAALAALVSWQTGGGRLVDISLHDVAAHALVAGSPGRHGTPAPRRTREARVRKTAQSSRARPDDTAAAAGGGSPDGWEVVVGSEVAPVAAPRARRAPGRASPLGADSAAVLGKSQAAC